MKSILLNKSLRTISTPSSFLINRSFSSTSSNLLDKSRYFKLTKQLATLGPASNNHEMIEKLFLKGADMFRLNFSHGNHDEKQELIKIIRDVERKYNHPITIIGDLQGPKLRIGTFKNNAKYQLEKNSYFTFDLMKEIDGDSERVCLPHPEILYTLKKGDIVLVDDGKISLVVEETTMKNKKEYEDEKKNMEKKNEQNHPIKINNLSLEMEEEIKIKYKFGHVKCKVINGGLISSKKGINTPNIILPISPITEKDKNDINFLLSLVDKNNEKDTIDYIALSFVQHAKDLIELKKILKNHYKIVSKIEKPQAIKNFEEILNESDAIMMARGDLGVEISPWKVPLVQKKVVKMTRNEGKGVIIATQMMESMIDSPTPTRAEASDCANSVYDLSDAVMLSAESASGSYPEEAVEMQAKIINEVQHDEFFIKSIDSLTLPPLPHNSISPSRTSAVTEAITLAAKQVAKVSSSKAIVAFTSTGLTALNLSRLRTSVPIFAIVPNEKLARELNLNWGIHPIVLPKEKKGHSSKNEFDFKYELNRVCQILLERGITEKNDLLTVTAGLPYGTAGSTNLLRVVSASGTDHPLH